MTVHDAIIVGAGPAGTSCAIWLKQLGFSPVLVERGNTAGGLQRSNPYTNTWIATSSNVHGPDVVRAMQENVLSHKIATRFSVDALGAEFHADNVLVRLANHEIITGRFLVLAGGVIPKSGGIQARLGIMIGSTPAVAKTNFQGARVAILGGGDSAFENYVMARDKGAKTLKVFARSLKARAEMVEKARPEDIHLGDYKVVPDASTVNGEPFDHILVMYGYEASPVSMLGLQLAMKRDGFISTDESCLTSHPLVYAIGEIANRAHPCCVTAMADGVVAAKSIQHRLESDLKTQMTGKIRRFAGLVKKGLTS